MSTPFPCTSCGACCRHVDKAIPAFKKMLKERNLPMRHAEFPHAVHNGRCEKLVNNQCSVYDNRPTLCNINKVGKILGTPKAKFYLDNIKACNTLMAQDRLPQEFRIKEMTI